MLFSKRSHEGYLLVDHRASPGIPAERALRMGLDPATVREGTMHEAKTYGCEHCGRCYIKNPLRERERAWCSQCDNYICDDCEATRRLPGYTHYTFRELADLITSGKYEMRGTFHRPLLIPK